MPSQHDEALDTSLHVAELVPRAFVWKLCFLQATVPNVPMKVLKEMCLTAARLLQQGELTAAGAELRLRRLSVQLALGSLAGLLGRGHFYFLEPEQVSADRLIASTGAD